MNYIRERAYLPCHRVGISQAGHERAGAAGCAERLSSPSLAQAEWSTALVVVHLQWARSQAAPPPELCWTSRVVCECSGVLLELDVAWAVYVLLCALVWWSCCPTRSSCVLTVCEEMYLKGCFDALNGLYVAHWAHARRLLNIVSSVLEIASWARQWRYCWAGRADTSIPDVAELCFGRYFPALSFAIPHEESKLNGKTGNGSSPKKCHPQNQ